LPPDAAIDEPPLSAIELLRSKSLPAVVQEEILRLILGGRLNAGDKLNEVEIATRLGVSRGPVREAFRALEEAGMVRLSKNRGVFVRELSPREAEEIYAVRAGLDELAGRLVAPRITDAEIAELRALVARMQASSTARDVDTYFPINIRFHDRVVEMTGNAKLAAIYRRLMNELHLQRRQGLARGGIRVSNEEHAAIVDALATRDPDRAAAAMREHVMAGHHRWRQSAG
jgi:phosphonate utilization transcriptional regulator